MILAELRQVEQLVMESEVPILEWSRKRHSRIADELEDEMEEELSDPAYVPPSGGESSSSDEADNNPKPRKRPRPSGPSICL